MSYFSLFQSPHPVRGATGSRSCWPPSQCHFNPRTPRGVRRCIPQFPPQTPSISIHAPREGCDTDGLPGPQTGRNFNPRTPRGVRRNQSVIGILDICLISIHAPREGCDLIQGLASPAPCDFNPRTPRGVRRGTTSPPPPALRNFNPRTPRGVRQAISLMYSLRYLLFQSTHPARGATVSRVCGGYGWAISIHAPREGCDHPHRRG